MTAEQRGLFNWCTGHGLDPLDAKRVHLELFIRYLEQERKNIPRSVAHHLTPVFGYYRFALVDDSVKSDPTVVLRRPAYTSTSPGSSRSTRARCSASWMRPARSRWSSHSWR